MKIELKEQLSEKRKKFGQELRELRKRKGMTQEELAELTGLSDNTIGYIENGKQKPTIETLYLFAMIFDMKTSEFFNALDD